MRAGAARKLALIEEDQIWYPSSSKVDSRPASIGRPTSPSQANYGKAALHQRYIAESRPFERDNCALADTASPEQIANPEAAFADEVARVRSGAGCWGEDGRLAELFDFLAERGAEAEAASQGRDRRNACSARPRAKATTPRCGSISTACASGWTIITPRTASGKAGRLTIPAGAYALRFAAAARRKAAGAAGSAGEMDASYVLPAMLVVLVVAAFFAGRFGDPDAAPVNPVWEPFLESDRPIVVAVGDYYIYGEIDPMNPEDGRLIRDFNINSKTDLARAAGIRIPMRYEMADGYGAQLPALLVAPMGSPI